MTIQLFYSAISAVSFPGFTQGTLMGTARRLDSLIWDAAAQMMVGVFWNLNTDADSNDIVFGPRIMCHKVWRDGKLIADENNISRRGFNSRILHPSIVPTNDGRVAIQFASANQGGDFWGFIINDGDGTSATGNGYYQVNPIFPGDVLTFSGGRLGEVSHLGVETSGGEGMLLPATSSAYALYNQHNGSSVFRIIHKSDTQSVTVISTSTQFGANSTWQHGRQIIPIDASTVAVTFRPFDFGLNPLENEPAYIRLFDTTSLPWTHLWEDKLPDNDQVAAYDPVHKVLYSCGKRASNAIMHASKLRRAPSSAVSASIQDVTQTEFGAQVRTGVSTTVLDGQNSVICNTLVRWTLDSNVSGGFFTSAYSLTNNSGVASITYVSPNFPSNLIERVNTTVASVEKC